MKLITRYDEKDIAVEVERFGTGYMLRIGDRAIESDFVNCGPFVRSLRLNDGTQYSLVHHREGHVHHITVAGTAVQVEAFDPLSLRRRGSQEDIGGGGGTVKAMMPGRVMRILVNKGDTVAKGAGLLIFEAMKMENEIVAAVDGVIEDVFVKAGDTVEGGADLLRIATNL